MTQHDERLTLVTGVFEDPQRARQLVEQLIRDDFPMDRISLLTRAGGQGDDMLGVSFHDSGERMRAWGKQGAFWGAIWGLLAGAAGLFLVPGLGPLLAAGPIVEALGGALAGAAVAGGAMAGAAALTEVATALHRIGIPEDRLHGIESAIQAGKTVVILHCDPQQAEDARETLTRAGADRVEVLPIRY